MKRKKSVIFIAFLCYALGALVSKGHALGHNGNGGKMTAEDRGSFLKKGNFSRDHIIRDILDNDDPPDDGTDETEVLEDVGVVAKEILDILKDKMVKGEPTTNLGHGGGDTVVARLGDGTDEEIIPISDLPKQLTDIFRSKGLKKVYIRPHEFPNYVFQLFQKKITEHHFGNILLSQDLTLNEIPVWAIEMFATKPTGSARDIILSNELPSWVTDQIKRWMEGMNDEIFKVSWNEMPLWTIKLVKNLMRSMRETVGLFSQRMTLEELLRWSIYSSRPKFEGVIPGIKMTLDDIPNWTLEFLKYKLDTVEGKYDPTKIYVTLREIFEWVFMVTRKNLIDSMMGNLVVKYIVKWSDFPSWFLDWVVEFLNDFKLIPRPKENPKDVHWPGHPEPGGKGEDVIKNPPKAVHENTPWSVKPEEHRPDKPKESPDSDTLTYWLHLAIKKKLEENGLRLEIHEIPEWIWAIIDAKIFHNIDDESVLGVRISLDEIIDWGIHLVIAGQIQVEPKMTWKDLSPWVLLLLQEVVEKNQDEVKFMMFTITLDELIDWSIKLGTDQKEGNERIINFEAFPDWLRIYIEVKIAISDKIPPWSHEYVLIVIDPWDKTAFKFKETLKGLPKWLIKLIQIRIAEFNDGQILEKFILSPQETPSWAVELVKIKVQKNYGVDLIMPKEFTWDTTPRWIIELIKGRIYRDSIEGTLMEHYVTMIDILDFSIWFTNVTNNGPATQEHRRVSLADVPDWLVDFLLKSKNWEHEDVSVMEEYITLSELLDWAILHNLRRKWGSDGDRILMFKDKLSELPKWGTDLLASKLYSFNDAMPPVDFNVPVVHLPDPASEYLTTLIKESYSSHPDMKPGLTPDKLPYWSLELLQAAVTEHGDVESALKNSWTIDELLQWVVWITKIKSFDMDLRRDLKVSHLPEWFIELLKTNIEESNDDASVMKHRITMEEILAWAIPFVQREKEEVALSHEETIKHHREIPNWTKPLLIQKIEEINQDGAQKTFMMPANQLPLWSMEIIKSKLENVEKVDPKIISFGIIELFQSRVLEFNGLESAYGLDMKLGDVVDWWLWITRTRKIGMGVNSNVALEEMPDWLITLLIRKKEMRENDGDVFDLDTNLDEIIDISMRKGIIEESEEDENKEVNGLPYWLVKIIVTKLRENYFHKFGKELGSLPPWAKELIFVKVKDAYVFELGVKPAMSWDMYPGWLVTFLNLHIKFEDPDESAMLRNVTMNELLEFAIWSAKRENPFLTFLELPEWIFEFLIVKLERNEGDRTILQHNMTLYEILELGVIIFVRDEVERSVHLGKVTMDTPLWIQSFLKERIRLINKDQINFQISPEPVNEGSGGIVIRKVNEIYGSNTNFTPLITAPYWILRFVEMKTEQQKSDTDAVPLQEVIDFGLWMTKRIKNLEETDNKRMLRFFDIPLWLLELLNMKAEVYTDEEALLQDQMTLEKVVAMAINTSVTRKTFKGYDLTLPNLKPMLNRIPSWIREILMMKVKGNEMGNEIKAFKFPNNQLPIWVVEFIQHIVEVKHEEIRKIMRGTIWDFVPYWTTLILQSKIQVNHGSVVTLDLEVTVEDVVDWAIWITNEVKKRTGMKGYVSWTEIPEWVVDFLMEKKIGRGSRRAVMEARLTLESLIDWAIDGAISKTGRSFKGIPRDVLRFILMEIEKVNDGRVRNRFLATRRALPRWAEVMIERMIRAIFGNDPLFISIVSEEIRGSWAVEFLKVVIYRLKHKENVVNYEATLKEIIEFTVWYTYDTINVDGTDTGRNIAMNDLPEWLIRLIRFWLGESDNVDEVLVDYKMMVDILHWSLLNNIPILTIISDDLTVPDLSRLPGPPPPPWVVNILVHEIGVFYGQRRPTRPRRPFGDISISVVQIFDIVVADRYKKIEGGEQQTIWETVPYWLIKFLQSMQVRHRSSKDIMSVKITIREVIHWLIEWIQDTYIRLGREGRVEWNNFPPWTIQLLITLEKEGVDPNKILEEEKSVGEIADFGICYVISLNVRKSDQEQIKRAAPDMPDDLLDDLFVLLFEFNHEEGVPEVKPDSPPLSSEVFDVFLEEALDVYGDVPDLRSLVEWELSKSWFIELIRWLINGGVPEKDILNHRLTFKEFIRYYLLYIQIIYGDDGRNGARDGRVVDLPEWFIKLLIFKYESDEDNPPLNSGISIEEIFKWKLNNSSPLKPEDVKIRDGSTQRPETPPWVIVLIEFELGSGSESYKPPKHEPPIPIVIYVLIEEFWRERYKIIEGGEPESVWDNIPHWLIKFLQAIIWRESGSRNIMEVKVTIREIIQWLIWWIRNMKEILGSEGNVELEDFPPWLIELIIRFHNQESPNETLDTEMTVKEFLVIIFEFRIKEIREKNDVEMVKITFEGTADVLLIEILRIVRIVNEEYYANPAIKPEYPDLPPWAAKRIQDIILDLYAKEPSLIPIVESEAVPHCIIELMKELIHRLKTDRLVLNYSITMNEFIKFSALYTHYIYNIDGTNLIRELRLTDLPGWLMKLIMFRAEKIGDPRSVLDERMTLESLLELVICNTVIVETLKTKDFEISTINIGKQPEWLIQYLQILINKHYDAVRPRNYVRPKNQLPVWIIRPIQKMVRRKFIELEYEGLDSTFDAVPYWIVQFIELMLEKHKSSNNVMNVEILISEAVALAIWRTQNLKLYWGKEEKVKLNELPEWLVEYIRDVGEGFNMNYLLIDGRTTVGQIVFWGIDYSMRKWRENDDLGFVFPLVEGIPEPAIRYILFQIAQVNRNRDRNRYSTSEIHVPSWAESTVRRIINEYYGNKAYSKIASIWEATPFWLLGLLKINLHKYDTEKAMWTFNMNLKEIIEYAVWLTKHVNDMEGEGIERNIRFIDVPEWLIEIIQMTAEYPKADVILEENFVFLELLTWGIRNSIRGKIFRYEDRKLTNETARPIPDWMAEVLLVKINHSDKDQFGRDFKMPMNHLPLWAVQYIWIKVREKYEAYQEDVPEAIWGSLPYWAAQFIQSKIQEHNNSIAAMEHQMMVGEVVDWVIWMSTKMKRETKEKLALTDTPRWLIDLLEMARGQNGKVEDIMKGKLTLEGILLWSINVTITEKLERDDLSGLRLTLKGIPWWVIELIQLRIARYNEVYPSNRFDSNLEELPQWAQDHLIKVIEDLYAKEPSPVLIEQATPYWIKAYILYKVNQCGSDSSIFETQIPMREIMEFTLWLTHKYKNENRNYGNRNLFLVRFIDLPYWFIELVKSTVPGNDDAEKLLNHRMKLDQLLIWAVHNSLMWKISGGDQHESVAHVLEMPEWLIEVLKIKIDRDYEKHKFKTPVNQLPVWIVEQIYKNNEDIGEVYFGKNYNISVPFWVIELIQSMTRSPERLTEVMDVSIQIDVIVDWVIWDAQRKKVMEGEESDLAIDEIPRWLIQLILKIDDYKDPKMVMNHVTSLRDILARSIIIPIDGKKEVEKLPDWIIGILREKIAAINDPKVPQKFEMAYYDLPKWVLELFKFMVEEHYTKAPKVAPIISLDTVPQWLEEYLKIKISENDIGPTTIRHVVRRDEFLDFSVWFIKHWTVTERDLTMEDVPTWTFDFIRTKVLTVGNDESALMRRITLYEIADWAIWYGVKKKLENDGLWDREFPRGLPFWLAHYLHVKVQDNNRDINPREFQMPNHVLPPWAVRIVKLAIKEVYDENPTVLPSLSWSTVSYWSLELFQSKIAEYNGNIDAVSSYMEIDELIDWSIWITKMRYFEMGKNQKLTVDDVPPWVIELLLMKLEGNHNDRSIIRDPIAVDVLLLWSMRNNMEKRKRSSYLTEVNITPVDDLMPDWLRLRLHEKMIQASNKREDRRFHISYYPIPAWMRVATRVKMEETFGRDDEEEGELPACWDALPQWTKELMKIKNEEMHGDEKVMDVKMTLNEILDYALWLSQKSMGWSRELQMEDVPDWVIEFVMVKIQGKSEDKILNSRVSLGEVLDYAVKSSKETEKIRRMASRHTEITEDELPLWVREFLERNNINEGNKPMDIPDWVAEIVKAELEESRAEKFLIKDYLLMKYLGLGGYSMIDKEELKSAMVDVAEIVDFALHSLETKVKHWKEGQTDATRPKELTGGGGVAAYSDVTYEMLVPLTDTMKGVDGGFNISDKDGLKKVLMVILNYADSGLHNVTKFLEKWHPTEPYSQRLGRGTIRLLKTFLSKSIPTRGGPYSVPPYVRFPPPNPPEQTHTPGSDSMESSEDTPVSTDPSIGAKEILMEMIKIFEITMQALRQKILSW